jgi:ubiquinone/menaquinone biosynthesis C-methylase UbiE
LRSPHRTALLEIDRVVALVLEGLRATRVLDVGTGTGIFAEAFAAKGLVVAGIDANAGLLPTAKRFVPTGKFAQATAEAIPFGDEVFDLAFLGHVLHEADDPVAALKEARRVSTQRVAVLEWPYVEEEQGPPLAHRLSVDSVVSMARRAGFERAEHLKLAHMDLYRIHKRPPSS